MNKYVKFSICQNGFRPRWVLAVAVICSFLEEKHFERKLWHMKRLYYMDAEDDDNITDIIWYNFSSVHISDSKPMIRSLRGEFAITPRHLRLVTTLQST